MADICLPSKVAILEPPLIVIALFMVIGVPEPIYVFPSKLIVDFSLALLIKVSKSLNVLVPAFNVLDFKEFFWFSLDESELKSLELIELRLDLREYSSESIEFRFESKLDNSFIDPTQSLSSLKIPKLFIASFKFVLEDSDCEIDAVWFKSLAESSVRLFSKSTALTVENVNKTQQIKQIK